MRRVLMRLLRDTFHFWLVPVLLQVHAYIQTIVVVETSSLVSVVFFLVQAQNCVTYQ